MKKVFSGYKYLEYAISKNWNVAAYESDLMDKNSWVTKSEGLTEHEMLKLGFFTSVDWMEDVSG